jgi:hypothetical protein
MARMMLGLGLTVLAGVLLAGSSSPVSAQDTGHAMRQLAAQRRPRIIVRPRHRHLSPNATRHCMAWLAKEYRPSGTVITPQMRCWWED